MATSSNDDELKLLKFPCEYRMKIFVHNRGQDEADLRAEWWAFLNVHQVEAVKNSSIDIQRSKNNRFLALRFNLWIKSREQIEEFIEKVKVHKDVVFIL